VVVYICVCEVKLKRKWRREEMPVRFLRERSFFRRAICGNEEENRGGREGGRERRLKRAPVRMNGGGEKERSE
jgi:hypothetical protein